MTRCSSDGWDSNIWCVGVRISGVLGPEMELWLYHVFTMACGWFASGLRRNLGYGR